MTWSIVRKRLPSRQLLLPAVILLIALVLRVGWPGLTEFKFSEARLEALVLEITREGRLPLVGVPSSAGFDHSPISVYLYVPPFILTTDPIPATIYGGLINLVAIWLAWRLARCWPGGGRAAALTTILLFAVSPWAVLFSRKIWQVAFVPLLSLAFSSLMISALVRGRTWALAGGLTLYVLLVQVHPSAVALAPALALWLVLFRREVRLRPLLTGVVPGAASALPFLAHQIRSGWPLAASLRGLPSARWDLDGIHRAWETITGLGIDALAGQSHPLLDWVPEMSHGFSLLGWLTIVSVLIVSSRAALHWGADDQRKRQAARLDLILVSWLFVPILFNLRHSMDLYLHFFSLVLPPAYLIVGRALQAVIDGTQQGLPRVLTAVGFGGFAVAQVVALVLVGRLVATHPSTGGFGTPLGDYKHVSDEVVELASREQVTEVLVVGPGDSPAVSEYPAVFDVLLRDRVSVRFVNGETTALFPQYKALVLLAPDGGEAAGWYLSWPVQEIHHGYRAVLLDGTWPLASFEPVTGARLFQNGVEIQGLRCQPALAGETYRVWMQWQVLWQSDAETHFFVQLLDDDGEVLEQQDGVGYSVLSRAKGDRIVSGFDINVSYENQPRVRMARVGQYLFPEIVNLDVIDQAGNPVGETVTVTLPELRP